MSSERSLVRRVAFERVSVRTFRNLASVELEPCSRLNVIAGDNGHGKTSLIEALYVVATSKSFRADKVREVVQDGAAEAVVRAVVRQTPPTGETSWTREQRALIRPRGRSFTLDGKKPERMAAYAIETPIIVFHPGDLELASGPAARRRTLLDRVLLYLDPQAAEARLRYQQALRDRQRLLVERGARPGARLGGDLDAYEQVAATQGARFAKGRQRAAERLLETLGPAFIRMAAPELTFEARYVAGGCLEVEAFQRELTSRRERDLRRGAATFGPQRDDLVFEIDGRPARSHGSQGQQRLTTLALKVAELECIRAASGAQPVLLLDDVSSELDPGRTGAVYEFLRATTSQVFVTTTRPELFVTSEIGSVERSDWTVRRGALESAQSR